MVPRNRFSSGARGKGGAPEVNVIKSTTTNELENNGVQRFLYYIVRTDQNDPRQRRHSFPSRSSPGNFLSQRFASHVQPFLPVRVPLQWHQTTITVWLRFLLVCDYSRVDIIRPCSPTTSRPRCTVFHPPEQRMPNGKSHQVTLTEQGPLGKFSMNYREPYQRGVHGPLPKCKALPEGRKPLGSNGQRVAENALGRAGC